ncbi:MAG TPA: hypothetical protein VHQ43_02960 [Solirubrobacterales bacterium]|jgi:hypothetical protein|nr:hypothetical protein [Solirubrobacterales bacterium]
MTLDDLVELEPEARPLRFHPEGGSFSHYGPIMYAPGGADPAVSNVTAHELNHYWMHSSTPYGAVLDELAELAGRGTIQYCAGLYNDGQSIPIPAMDVARAFQERRISAERHGQLHLLAGRHVVPWTHDVLLENWFEGVDLASVRSANLAKLLRWLVDYEDRSRAMRPDDGLFADSPPPFSDYQRRFVLYWADALDSNRQQAFPTIGPTGGAARPLGAQHLFEACAQQVEQVDEAFWEGASQPVRDLYWGLFASLVAKFPGTVDSAEGFRSIVSTFMVLADLALFTPVGRVYGRLREDSMSWLDLHPGWRFQRLLDVLKPDDWLEGVDDKARHLQWRLCVTLGWPPPDRFLTLGAKLAPVTHDLARHAAACRMRLEEDDRLIVDAGFDAGRLEPFLVDHYPIFIRESETTVGGSTIADRLHPLVSYSLASFAWMVMRDGSLRWPELFPPKLDFRHLFDNIDSYEGMIGMYRDIVPFYPDDAFCSAADLAE